MNLVRELFDGEFLNRDPALDQITDGNDAD